MSDNQDKPTPRGVVSWILGIVFLFLGFFSLIGSKLAALAFIAVAALILPPARYQLARIRINPSRLWRGALVALLFIIGFVAAVNALPETNPSVKYEPKQEEQPAQEQAAPEREVTYKVVSQWEIPNGGFGKAIVIAPEDVTEERMVALARKIDEDTKGDRNAVFQVFDDEKSAGIYRDIAKLLLTDAESDEYLSHFVGQYVRNGNNGYHSITIYFDGMGGTNSKEIKL